MLFGWPFYSVGRFIRLAVVFGWPFYSVGRFIHLASLFGWPFYSVGCFILEQPEVIWKASCCFFEQLTGLLEMVLRRFGVVLPTKQYELIFICMYVRSSVFLHAAVFQASVTFGWPLYSVRCFNRLAVLFSWPFDSIGRFIRLAIL